MSFSSWFDIVASPVRAAAAIVLGLAVVIGTTAGLCQGYFGSAFSEPRSLGLLMGALIGLLGGLFVGGLFALFILSLGYVYADSKRRNMPAVPWTLIALFVPNLLGFLLYFVLRKPIASPCPNCGQPLSPEQRFCSWCGYQRPMYGTPLSAPSNPGGVSANPLG